MPLQGAYKIQNIIYKTPNAAVDYKGWQFLVFHAKPYFIVKKSNETFISLAYLTTNNQLEFDSTQSISPLTYNLKNDTLLLTNANIELQATKLPTNFFDINKPYFNWTIEGF
jgi:hypothetical protein